MQPLVKEMQAALLGSWAVEGCQAHTGHQIVRMALGSNSLLSLHCVAEPPSSRLLHLAVIALHLAPAFSSPMNPQVNLRA